MTTWTAHQNVQPNCSFKHNYVLAKKKLASPPTKNIMHYTHMDLIENLDWHSQSAKK